MGFLCFGKEKEFFPVQVGDLTYDITIGQFASQPQNVTSCTYVELCFQYDPGCTDILGWKVNGNIISSTTRCITYFLNSCPLVVEVEFENPCSVMSETFEKTFSCNDPNNPIEDYPTHICLGETWSLDIPGSLLNVNVLSNGPGNNVIVNNNISFVATEIGSVVMQITYEICGKTHSLFIHVSVIGCDGLKENDNEIDLEMRSNAIGENKFGEIKVFPNPASHLLNFHFLNETNLPESVSIFDSNSRMVLNFDPKNLHEKIDISELSNGVYFIQLDFVHSSPYVTPIIIER